MRYDSCVVAVPLRNAIRKTKPEWLYPLPVSSLQPERLYAYMHALVARRHLEGDVVEIGCWLGGTAALASRLISRTGPERRYVCIDTFNGFVDGQFNEDGAPENDRHLYDRSSMGQVRKLLDSWGAGSVELVKEDVSRMHPGLIPGRIVVGLVDVDLEIPTHDALVKVSQRLVPGGIILVDDCPESTSWVGARRGYQRFCEETGRVERYEFGFGIVEAA